ncbi:Ig-like domain-containing protein, partial [Pseudomonas sp. MWU12-2323]|uniref:Ig-like domain-containing protein n=2 Tax=Pseudomonas TaxID=286 RepID=UPI001383A78C
IKSPVAGMPAYPNIEEGDRIFLYWGSEKIEHVVTDEEANDPDNHVIVITVDKAVIDEEGDSEADGIPVAFYVLDVVNNRSEDWSTTIRIDVDTGSPRLTAPIIEEAFNNVLNMDTLPNPDTVTARVMAMNLVPGRTDFAPGDEIEIRLRGISLEGETVDRVYELKTVTSVPSIVDIPMPSIDVRLLVNTRAALSYRLVKADGSADLRSKSQFIEVIGEARQLAAPIAEDAIAGTLDPALPYTLIEIPWDESMTEGQAIDLKWLGTRGTQIYFPSFPLRLISHGEERDKESLHISVDGEHLRAIDGGTLELFYLLLRDTDAREVVSRQSLHADLLNIGEPVAELPPPDVEGEQDGVLDPADVPAGTRLIVRQYDGQIRGDKVHYVWNGSRTGIKTDSTPITEINETSDIPFSINFDLIKNNEGGTVKASYWVKRVTGRISPSEVLPMDIGTAMDLAAPSVKQATGVSPNQQLNPVAAKDTLTVEIPDYGIRPGDQVRVTWAGTAGAGSHTTPLQALPGSREIPVPVEVLAYNLDRSVTVTYTVTPSGGSESEPSRALTLNVQAIPDISLPMPLIPQAAQGGIGSELDLSTFIGDTRVTVAPWPLIAAGQRVWLHVEGTAVDNSPYTIPLYTAYEVVPSEVTAGLSTPLLRSELEKLRDGSALNVVLQVTFDQSSTQANAVDFPLRTYTLKTVALVAPTITAVSESATPAIPNGGVTAATSVVLTGRASPGFSIDLFDNDTPPPKGTFVATGGTWTTTTPIAVAPGPHSFTAKAKYGSEPVSGAWTFTVITLTDQNKPYIQQAENNGTGTTLDLSTFTGDATVKVSPWPGIAAKQRVWLRCLGKKANGSDHIITLYTASEVIVPEVTNGLSKNIPRAQLGELGNNTPLTVELKIKFNGSTSDEAATVFPLRTYTVKTFARLEIDTSTVQLNGFFVYTGMQRNATPMPAGTTITRRPTSGTPPFTYRSSNNAVAQVDGNGVVIGYKNGQATIEVSDTFGQTVSYPIVRSNAWKIATIPSIQGANAPAWANSVGANNSFNSSRPDGGTMAALRQYYVMAIGWNYDHWTGQFENNNPNWPLFTNPYTGYISTSAREAWLGAYCRVPDN